MKFARKLKTLENKTGQKIKNHIKLLIENHDKYKKSYFWNPPANASGRRSMEFSENLEFIINGETYIINQDLECSCSNVYWSNNITVNGSKKNITCLKKLIS